jgi:hypothetical protein
MEGDGKGKNERAGYGRQGNGENDVATVSKYWWRLPRGIGAQAGVLVLLEGESNGKGKSKRAGSMAEADEDCREKWGGGINAAL